MKEDWLILPGRF